MTHISKKQSLYHKTKSKLSISITTDFILLHEIINRMILRNISLKKYNTFGLDYKADYLISIKTEDEAVSLLHDHKLIHKPILILGRGSNILFTEDFKGTILHPEIEEIKIETRNPDYSIISAGSGINWDTFIEWCVFNGFGGLENLSLIPGFVGASPVQNIGAYGVEVKDLIEKVRAVSIENGSIIEFNNDDCMFGYRNSIFKGDFKDKYLITRVYFKLTTRHTLKLDYGSLKEEINTAGEVSLKNVREAVINLRRSKLPDPETIGNAGSFFKNPVVSTAVAENLKKKYPLMPVFENMYSEKKLAAGWMIDNCGWKGKRIGNTGVHDKQALVIVNYGNASGKEIYNLSEVIKKSVTEKFGVNLEREVIVIGAI